MPVPTHPLTPASSTDIASQDHTYIPSQVALRLPPPAIPSLQTSKKQNAEVGAEFKPSAPSSDASRKRKRAGEKHKTPNEPRNSAPILPPPPTRPRTIIQVQPGTPRTEKGQRGGRSAEKSKSETTKRTAPNSGNGGKRAARKTAHSVIEKRRRSKMNEEFDTMKEMIPACRGQTMHKLAILQAGIEYMGYLEQCVMELKAASTQEVSIIQPDLDALMMQPETPSSSALEKAGDGNDEDDEDDSGEDSRSEMEMQDRNTPNDAGRRPSSSHTSGIHGTAPNSQTVSPLLFAVHGSPIVSARGAADYTWTPDSAARPTNDTHSADYEATAALLMLNGDRAFQTNSKSGRGLSVQDLLSG